MDFPGSSDSRLSLQCRRPGLGPWVRKISWRRKWQSPPVFLPGEVHGQKSLGGYSPWGSQRVRHDWATNIFTFTHRGSSWPRHLPGLLYHGNFSHWTIKEAYFGMLHIKANRLLSFSLSPSCHQFHHIPVYRLKYHLFKWFTDDGLVGYGCKFP